MTQDDILRLAHEAGVYVTTRKETLDAMLERFAALIAAKEREACAQVFVEISKKYWMGDAQFEAATRCLNTIRARNTK